jgi:hypothetical protein
MMTKEIHKKSPETIEDLYYRNFTIISCDEEWSLPLLTSMIPDNRRPKIANYSNDDYYGVFDNHLKNESAKLAVLITENPAHKGVRLKEILFTDTAGLVMRRNQFLYWLTEETLRDLITGGIPQQLVKFYEDINYPLKKEDPADPKVLSIDDLHYGFVIWIVASYITLIAFIAEFLMNFFIVKLWNGVKKNLQKLLGIIFVMKWLRDYLRKY